MLNTKFKSIFCLLEFDSSSPGENHSTSSVGPLMGCSSGTPSISRTTLAEDIHAIKLSLEGATSSSREKILKILERLTARLVQAETARDNAMSKLTSKDCFERVLTI